MSEIRPNEIRPNQIHLWGVRQNNLKNIEVQIPLGSFTVVCGPSGSGKSSLAFETLYAEGQRRYIESLSNYTKQFLNKAPKPDADGVENIPPAISLEQKNGVRSSRSSVGTTTEVIDFLRLIFEKVGVAQCPTHKIPLAKQSPSQATKVLLTEFKDRRAYLLVPVDPAHWSKASKGKKTQLLALLLQEGLKRIFKSTGKSGAVEEIDAKSKLPSKPFFVVVDRMAITEEETGRITDSFSQAYSLSLKLNPTLIKGLAHVITTEGEKLILSEETSCRICNHKFPDITASLFSFNSPVGACGDCKGFGNILRVDPEKVIPNPQLTLSQGAIKPFAMPSAAKDRKTMFAYCKKHKIDLHTPWVALPEKQRQKLWRGDNDFWGVEGLFEYLETKKYKMHVRVFLARHKSPFQCPTCKGSRLKPEALQVLVSGKNVHDLSILPVQDLRSFFEGLSLSPAQVTVCEEPLRQIQSRLQFLCDVGVGYLTLDRPTKTLSGGEYQRLNLSNQLGVGLSQTLYVLDEPTIGLHPRDNDRLIRVLKGLNELGNTLVVVEHDHDVINNASHILEMGPGSGHLGGEVMFSGTREQFIEDKDSLTAAYLDVNRKWTPTRTVRPVDIDTYKYVLELRGCSGHNLQKVDFRVPLNRFVTVTGVSGSGKSSLVSQTLYPALARALDIDFLPGLPFKEMRGAQHLKNVLFIDQSPIGSTARSSPVTYLKIYDAIRTVMASSNEARDRGYTPSTFSLNVNGGRCPACEGLGVELIDMIFMDDIEIPCEVCQGKKFRPEVLEIQYRGKNINDVLNMTVSEAMDFFVAYPNIRRPLSLLREVGLDYIRLGQSARSLSGGESQRLKVAREFNGTNQNNTLYILDEPTSGLHFREIELLIKVLNRLVDAGGSVLLIEHNLDVIRNSDYLIDLGPEAGAGGGQIVAAGTPDEVKRSKKSLTARYL
jgi:excinuclease ABC subunit A